MTIYVLADRQPRAGQVVLYRLRPTDPLQPATWTGREWRIDEHTTQAARAHHQWTPAPKPQPHKHGGPARRLLGDALRRHPGLVEEWP